MAGNIKISQLPSLSTMSDSAVMPVVSTGDTQKITGLNLKNYFQTGLANVAFSGDYSALANLPTSLSDFVNDEGFITDAVVGNFSATGNISGTYLFGNGSFLTGIAPGYTDSNVSSFLANYGSNTISTTGNITAGNINASQNVVAVGNVSGNFFIGNGSQLTGLPTGPITTVSSSAPANPAQGDIWIDSDTGVQVIYFNDGNSSQWAEMEAYQSFSGSGLANSVSFSPSVANNWGNSANSITNVGYALNYLAQVMTALSNGNSFQIPGPYADNAAAVAAGLTQGRLYYDTTGLVRVVI